MNKKICLLTDQHICTNPRLWKEALSLSKAGYEVVILTTFTTESELVRDYKLLEKAERVEYKSVLNLIPCQASNAKRFYYRLRRKLAVWVKLYVGIEASYLLGYAPDLLFTSAKKENALLYVAHMECSQYVGKQLSQRGFKVAFDIEDWYSKDYLVPARPIKLLQKLEKFALVNGAYVTCPSDAMASAIQKFYSVKRKPIVVYNSFSTSETPVSKLDTFRNTTFSILWFSQTIGPGRGLEKIIEALNLINLPIVLKLIGDVADDYRHDLEHLFHNSGQRQLVFSDQIPHHELSSEIEKHDLGLALENIFPESRNLTVTNKILQYTQVGIRVLATNTKGQREIAELFPESVILVNDESPELLANIIEKLITDKFNKSELVKNRFKEIISWESQTSKILNAIQSLELV